MPHFYHYYQLRPQSIEIGSRPQFYTLCLSPIRIISLLSDAHRASWILCALLKCGPAPAATAYAALTCLDGWAAKLESALSEMMILSPRGTMTWYCLWYEEQIILLTIREDSRIIHTPVPMWRPGWRKRKGTWAWWGQNSHVSRSWKGKRNGRCLLTHNANFRFSTGYRIEKG